MVPADSQNSSCSALLRVPATVGSGFAYGAFTSTECSSRGVPRSPDSVRYRPGPNCLGARCQIHGLGSSPVIATTGESLFIFLLRGAKMFQFPGSLSKFDVVTVPQTDLSHWKSPDQWPICTSRSLSQLITSFIAPPWAWAGIPQHFLFFPFSFLSPNLLDWVFLLSAVSFFVDYILSSQDLSGIWFVTFTVCLCQYVKDLLPGAHFKMHDAWCQVARDSWRITDSNRWPCLQSRCSASWANPPSGQGFRSPRQTWNADLPLSVWRSNQLSYRTLCRSPRCSSLGGSSRFASFFSLVS